MASDCAIGNAMHYDSETGEAFQAVICLRSSSPVANEQMKTRSCETTQPERSKFRVPPELRLNASENTSKTGLEERIVDRTENFGAVVLMLPTLFLFPAWASILCAFSEAAIHIWTHRMNKIKDSNIVYRSPFNFISSEFCAKCRSEKSMQKIGEIQDKRSLRRNLIDPSVVKHVLR